MRSKLIGQSPEYNMLYEILRKTERITQMAPHIGWNNGPIISPEQEIVNTFNTRVEEDGGVFEAEDCLVSRITVLRNLGLWDGASAAWLPHAYKESKLYAVKGGSGVDLGFTRAGTKRRKASTYVEQVPYNLLSRSEEFDNASWVKNACTVTANSTTAPNSELSADSLLETIAVSGHFLRQSITKPIVATTYRFSVNVKANNRDWCLLQIGGTVSLAGVYFNVATGAIGSQRILGSEFSIVSSSIEAANNGFYKLTIVVTGTNTETSLLVDISTASSDGVPSYAGNTSNGLFLWGAQLTYGSVARDYFKTTDRFNIPSLDYSGATCPALSLEPARTNLCLRSQEFDNATWAKAGATITANDILAPDGTLTAGKLLETAPSAAHQVNQTFTKAASVITYTASVYMRGGLGRDWGQFAIGAGSNAVSGYYNLTTGTVGSAAAAGVGYTVISSSMVACTNGWYRCILTFTTDTGTSISWPIRAAESDGVVVYTGDITKGVYLWGAQLEVGSYATSYIPTTTATVSRIADSVPALLPKGTNQCLQSQTFSNASWVKTDFTVTENNILAPDGTLTADRILESATSTTVHTVVQTVSKPSGTKIRYTASIYVKGISRDFCSLILGDGAGNATRMSFNITTGELGSQLQSGTGIEFLSATITPANNSFYRLTVSGVTNTAANVTLTFIGYDAIANSVYTGDITKGYYIWGAQLEQGDEATTYVATTTAPVHNGTVIGQTQGSMYFEGSSFADNTNKYITLNNGAANDRVSILFSNTNTIVAQVLVGGVSQAAPSAGAFTTGTNYKICISWNANNVYLHVNGALAGAVDTSATIPTCNQLVLALNGTTNPFYGNLKALVLYPTQLTQAQAAALTA